MHKRTAKRKRNDSLSSSNGETVNDMEKDDFDTVIDTNNVVEKNDNNDNFNTECDNNQTNNGEPPTSQQQQQNSLENNEQSDVVNNNKQGQTNTSNSGQSVAAASATLRRKSNRILSLKRSFVPSQQQQQQHNGVQSLQSLSEDSTQSLNVSLDSITDTTNTTNNNASEISPIEGTTPSSSSSAQSTSTSRGQTSTASTGSTTTTGKSLRKIQLWTVDDTRWFFEALCEHGKDFPHIQSYIAARCEKKGIPPDMIKNYEQVRHFYYRMWHKISQMLNISNEVEKCVQEIYGLVNYGEIWKKFGAKFDSKLSSNLQQLVDQGYTVFKVKGKNIRVRTPFCNALKRIHNIHNKNNAKSTTPPIPKQITVELVPATNSDWLRVQALAQNPRLRTTLQMQQRLSSVISYLERRWSLTRIKDNGSRQILGVGLYEGGSTSSTTTTTNQSTDSTTCSTIPRHQQFAIRLRPPSTEKLAEHVTLKSTTNSISMNNSRSTTHAGASLDLSLSSYLKNVCQEDTGKKSKARKSNKKVANNQIETTTTNTKNEIKEEEQQQCKEDEPSEQPMESIDVLRMLDSMNEELDLEVQANFGGGGDGSLCQEANRDSQSGDELPEDNEDVMMTDAAEPSKVVVHSESPAQTTVAQLLAILSEERPSTESSGGGNTEVREDDDKEESVLESANSNAVSDSKSVKKDKQSDANASDVAQLLTAEQARLGWNLQEAETVTIGELYLLYQRPAKIVLEYGWDKVQQEKKSKISNEGDAELSESSSAFICDDGEPDSMDESEDDEPRPTQCLLQQLIWATNVALMKMKAKQVSAQNSTGSNSAGQGNKSSRSRRATKNAQESSKSQLLSNLIQETILDESGTSGLTTENGKLDSETDGQSGAATTNTVTKAKSSKLAENNEIVDKTAGSRTNQPQGGNTKSVKSRTTAVLDDPAKVEEVLNELNAGTSRRPQRRSMQKSFMYNLHNQMLAAKKRPVSVNGRQQALLVIPASRLASAGEGSSNAISLSDLLGSHLPQASISLATTNSSNAAQQGAQSPVLIPIQVAGTQQVLQAKEVPISAVAAAAAAATTPTNQSSSSSSFESTNHQSQVVNTNPLTLTLSAVGVTKLQQQQQQQPISEPNQGIDSEQLRSVNLEHHLQHNTGQTQNQRDYVNDIAATATTVLGANFAQHQIPEPMESSSSSNEPNSGSGSGTLLNISKPSSADLLTQSQLSWLNEANDFSVGSFFSAYDMPSTDELHFGGGVNDNARLSTEFEPHLNGIIDNSVDLIGRFDDMAAQISTETKNI